jgi:phytoene dehydrogenase-like protein
MTPAAAAAHPLDDGTAAILWNDLARTCDELGSDGPAWNRIIGATTRAWNDLEDDLLAPVGIPRHPIAYTRFALGALRTADGFARGNFSGARARALYAGVAAHGVTPFTFAGSAAVGIVLSAAAHVRGWPAVRGGSQQLADALAAHFRSLGGEIVTDSPIGSFDQLPAAKQYFFDTSPRVLAAILGARAPSGFQRSAAEYAHGPGVFKVDWALREPIPWRARDCALAGTVHVGGTLDEIAAAEAAPWKGEHAERPYVLVTQPSIVDASRAPAGQHTAWGYCHVPNGSSLDVTARIEAQIERFAPGFRDLVIARSVRTPQQLEAQNANLVGGDIGGGANTLMNILFRPTWRHYNTGVPNVHLCSASTPPGGGVHGMCGYHAATRVLGR